MADRVVELGPNHRIIVDDSANTWNLQFYDSASAAWVDILTYDTANQKITSDVDINKSTPAAILRGTETDAIIASLKENGGAAQITDDTNAVTLLNLNANQPVVIDIPVPIVFESAQTGLAADSTGIKFTSQNIIPPLANYHTVAIEATWTAADTDSVMAVEIYDQDAGTVVASVSGNTGTDAKSSYATITAGNSLVVRANITTASATTGSTDDLNKAVIYFRVTLS